MSTRYLESPDELLHREHYTPEELAKLLDMDLYIILHAVWTGRLKAFVCDHHVVDIHRDDVIRWLQERG